MAAADDKDLVAHIREHALMGDAHQREHDTLAREMGDKDSLLADNVRSTAAALADSVKTTAEIHWRNHEREHQQADRAMDKAGESLDARLENMNKIREQMAQQAATFNTREAADNAHRAIDDKIAMIQKYIDSQIGKQAGAAPMWGIVLAVVTAVVVLIATRFFIPG